ncbi:isocitrate lyase/PEP mutase family protein [Phenylobacterium deserti]|uniref:Isocitrate lyase/phosphoenolpyruvate mutase family protein n=1 Tax=Phenylobacterium deserti TaxID=1914756 RepID=A0A328AQ68_9CAUL|nr:isocitrate lyase/phosphoenolpyruvate mutase family protein [Phenylobacterium deserti]RAK57150.1 isocitrate lyase/phosphoenolpyruvate mutase family protein [Phenylobacterium deserti]
MNQTDKAERFAALHRGAEILVLPNAWDAASAALMEAAGAKAVATSSAAVAWAHGYPDGDALPLDRLIATIEAAARNLTVPLSADIEGGYTDDLQELADTVRRVIGAGAVGINLEDGLRTPDLAARKVEAARKAAEAEGAALFINARTDVYLRNLSEGHAAYVEAITRAELYRAAGASGIFIPGPTDEDLIGRLADAVRLPLNVMGRAGAPSAARLQALGVRRLSSATAPFRVAYAAMAAQVADYLASGDSSALAAAGQGLPDLNARFAD